MVYTGGSEGVIGAVASKQPARLLAEAQRPIAVKHYSLRTEQAYVAWIRRFILFHGRHHPQETGGDEVERFLSDLALGCVVAASTQNQALSALLFLYRQVLELQLPWMDDIHRAR